MPGLLVLLAHPDDEFFCAGLLAAVAEKKIPVHLVYWTRGEGGGSPRARKFWGLLPTAWRPRVREARKAAALLGAASIDFLGAIDPAPDPHLRAPEMATSAVIKSLVDLVQRYAPELILTHGSAGEYGHPAHQRLGQIAREFVATHPGLPLISFAAALAGHPADGFLNAADPPDFIFDAAPYLATKRAVVWAHRSQRGVFENLPGAGGSLEAVLGAVREEGYHAWTERERALDVLKRWTAGHPH